MILFFVKIFPFGVWNKLWILVQSVPEVFLLNKFNLSSLKPVKNHGRIHNKVIIKVALDAKLSKVDNIFVPKSVIYKYTK